MEELISRICPICFKEFTPRPKQQRYCSRKCYDKSQLLSTECRREAKLAAIEWLAWNQDFKLGKTVSNL